MATINVETRQGAGKGVARKLRREGKVPAVLYGGNQQPLNLSIVLRQLNKLIETEGSGLKTQHQDLVIDGKTRAAILVRDIQHHPLSSQPVHVDFFRFDPTKRITVDVPVTIVDEEKAPGIKRGGIVQTVRRVLEVTCLAGEIPEEIIVSVKGLDIGDSIHINDIALPEGAEVQTEVNFTVAVVVGVKTQEMEEADAEAAEAAAQEKED